MVTSFHFCPECSYRSGMTPEPATTTAPESVESDELVAEDLIEEVSIDGMCGVY
jgi:mycofactocin precursor